MDKTNQTLETKKEVKNSKKDYIFAVGRRKSSVVRVRLSLKNMVWDEIEVKKGEVVANKKKAEEYFGKGSETVFKQPLIDTNMEKKFAVSIVAAGGGKAGQLTASVLGIARALDKFDKEKFHRALKKRGYLTRDPRVRERRKAGTGGKARRTKQSPKP